MGVEAYDKLKLYIRLPFKIEEEAQVRLLHPDISEVRLPRQKSRRWCFIYFETKEKLTKAKKQLRKSKINGKYIRVLPPRKNKQPEPDKRPAKKTKGQVTQ